MTNHGVYRYKRAGSQSRRAARRVKSALQLAYIAWDADDRTGLPIC